MNILDLVNTPEKVRNCEITDITTHYSIVNPLVKSTDRKEYQALMLQAVIEKTAYTLLDNSSFLYYIKENKRNSKGITFYGKDNPMGMMIIFEYAFNVIDTDMTIMRFYPHESGIKDYKSLLLLSSIKKWHRSNSPVVIRIDKIKDKMVKLLNKRLSNG